MPEALEPRAAGALAPAQHVEADLPLLLVEDEAAQRRALERLLAPTGWDAVICANAEEALAALAKQRFAVVVSDYRMPGMDGVGLLTRVRELDPDAERILMTGNADAEALERGVNEARISRFVKKPWDPDVLAAILEEAQQLSILRRENAVLVERLANRNDELSYLNQQLGERAARHDRAASRFRRRWDVALNAISDPILVIGKDLRVEGANLAAAAMAGAPADSLEGRKCHEVLFGRSQPCVGCPLVAGHGQITGPGPEGVAGVGGVAKTWDARAYRLPGPTGEKAGEKASHLVVYRDVMAAVGSLASAIADQINNPLHAILSFVQLAQRPAAAADKLPRYLEAIHESALRCRDAVDGIRELSRHEKPREGSGK